MDVRRSEFFGATKRWTGMRQLLNGKTPLDRRHFGRLFVPDRISLGFPAGSSTARRCAESIIVHGNAIRKEIASDRNDLYAGLGAGIQAFVAVRCVHIKSVPYNHCDAGNLIKAPQY